MKKERTLLLVKDSVIIVFASLLYSVGINMFSVPNNIVQGGLTGVSIILHSLFPIVPVGTAMFALNIPLFILGFLKVGKSFIIKTFFTLLIFSAAIDGLSPFIPTYVGDSLLACLFCGTLCGTGLALVLYAGSSTGGTEIAATLIKQKSPQLPMGRAILLVDLVVIAGSYFVYKSLESIMYALVSLVVSSTLIDFILGGAGRNKMVIVITREEEKVTQALMNEIHRGVTVLDARGGYTGKDIKVVFCAARSAEIAKINRKISLADPQSFTVSGNVGEIFGNGWKSR